MGLGDRINDQVAEALLKVEQHSAEVASGLALFNNGQRLTAARPMNVTAKRVWGGSGRLVGWSVKATGGPVTVLVRDSRDSEGQVLAVIDLLDTESETVSLGTAGVSFGEGIYLDRSGAGTLIGSVWLGGHD